MEEVKKIIKTCLEKEDAFCTAACPFHMNIREFIARMQCGSFNTAFRTYSNAVGFPGIVAELCDEVCKNSCPGLVDHRAIELKMLEKAAINYAMNTQPHSYNMPPKDKSIAIIGAGISGLACALRMANRKYKVTVFEKADRIGGHLWKVMPPKIFITDIERQFIYEKVTLKLNTTINDLEELDFDAIYIATGIGGNDFGLGKNGTGNLIASSKPGVFLGGSMLGATSMEAIAVGLCAATFIQNYLKTGNMISPDANSPTQMCLDPSARILRNRVLAASGVTFSKEEAVAEAKRCLKCQCDACIRHCDLMNYFEKFPKRIAEEVEITIHPGTLDGNGTVATRFISTCNQCGLCKEVCPKDIDMGEFLCKGHREMHEKGAMPWAFHDFWLRDMEFAISEKISLALVPEGYSKSEYFFFPGCQLGASDERYVLEAYRFLLKNKPDTALMLSCCGAPAVWAGDEVLHVKVLEKLKMDWFDLGKPKAIFACPTCKQMFEKYLPEMEGVFLYDVLLEYGIIPVVDGNDEIISIFDPCSSRYEPVLQQNIRKLAKLAGFQLQPLPYEGKRAQCCSWGGQMSITNPPYTKWIIERRIVQSDVPYVAYCSNCRDIFMKAGKPVKHILDILFGLNDWRCHDGQMVQTVSDRRRNRMALKNCVLEEFWHTKLLEEEKSNKAKLVINKELREKLSAEMLLEDDVMLVIENCESSERKVIDPETNHVFGYMEVGNLTHWVEYIPLEDGFELINAYSHRMKIQLEEVWNGRKQKIDML